MSNQSRPIPRFPKALLEGLLPSTNYLIGHANSSVEKLNVLSSKLPRRHSWRFLTADAFSAEAKSIFENCADYNLLYWTDTLGNCEAYSLTNVWRMIELAQSGILSLRGNETVSASLVSRAGLENAAQFVDFARWVSCTLGLDKPKMKKGSPLDPDRDLKTSLITSLELEKYLLKTIFASRLPGTDKLYEATDVLTSIDRITRSPGQGAVRPAYNILCEVAHPNFLGRSLYILDVKPGQREGDEIRTIGHGHGHGPSKTQVVEAMVTALSWSCWAHVTAFNLISEAIESMRARLRTL